MVEEIEFAESKASSQNNTENGNVGNDGGTQSQMGAPDADGFMNIPDGIGSELPFN